MSSLIIIKPNENIEAINLKMRHMNKKIDHNIKKNIVDKIRIGVVNLIYIIILRL